MTRIRELCILIPARLLMQNTAELKMNSDIQRCGPMGKGRGETDGVHNSKFQLIKADVYITSCWRAAATIMPPLLCPCGRRSALRHGADGNITAISPRPTRSHTHLCSRLTRQHSGEQSGLVTLTFLLTLKVVSQSRVM